MFQSSETAQSSGRVTPGRALIEGWIEFLRAAEPRVRGCAALPWRRCKEYIYDKTFGP